MVKAQKFVRKHEGLAELFMLGQEKKEQRSSPMTALMMHRALPSVPPRSKQLQHFFKQIEKCASSGAKGSKYENKLGNTKAGAYAIDKETLEDLNKHWGSFSSLEKQQVLMSFLHLDPEKLRALGKEGQDIIHSIIDNAQSDEDTWIVVLSRTMRNFPRSHSIRANSADRESWYYLNKAVEQGMEAGLMAAAALADENRTKSHSSTGEQVDASEGWENLDDCSASTPPTPAADAATTVSESKHAAEGEAARTELTARSQHAAGSREKEISRSNLLKKGFLYDSIPPLGAQTISCWPATRHGHPPEYTVQEGKGDRSIRPLQELARQEMTSVGFRPGTDLRLAGDMLLEDFSNHQYSLPSDLQAWKNDSIWKNNEWVKKAKKSNKNDGTACINLHGFERSHIVARGPDVCLGRGRSHQASEAKRRTNFERSRSREKAKRKSGEMAPPNVPAKKKSATPGSASSSSTPTPAAGPPPSLHSKVKLKDMRWRPEKNGLVGEVIGTEKGKVQVRLEQGGEEISILLGVTGTLEVISTPKKATETEYNLFGSELDFSAPSTSQKDPAIRF